MIFYDLSYWSHSLGKDVFKLKVVCEIYFAG